MSADPVGLGVVGLGWWGRVLADSIGRTANARLVACFARTESTRNVVAAGSGCDAPATLGDPVLLFGREAGESSATLPVEEVAETAGTISYELLVRVGARVRRVVVKG